MTSNANLASSVPSWENFPLTQTPNHQQLQQIQAHLDLVLLALESLVNFGKDLMGQTALDLEIGTAVTDKIILWSNRSPNQTDNSGVPLSVEQVRSLILMICYVAQQHQELIRRAVTLVEQMAAQNKDPDQITLLSKYFQTFHQLYQSGIAEGQQLPTEQRSKLASKLLIDLLFYSADSGHHRLWLTLLDYTR